jgi:very-short-patch-repair endonuclease
MTAALSVTMTSAPRVNLALQQNGVPLLRDLVVSNTGPEDEHLVRVTVTAEPPLFEPWEHVIDTVRAGSSHHVPQVGTVLSPTFLARQAERELGGVTVSLTSAAGTTARLSRPLEVLAPTEWLGVGVLPELLAAFVRPNAPVLVEVLKSASDRLQQETGSGALSGYQSRDPKRVWLTVKALYESVQATGPSYINPPASFETTGQKVRTHEAVLEGRLGTCLDLTVLMAALMEQTGLHPLLLLVEGHAFPGVWLTDFSLKEPALDDPEPIRKRVELGEALVFDSSAVASGASFEAARLTAEAALKDNARFRLAIDVRCARLHGTLPLPLERTGDALVTQLARAPQAVAPSALPEDRFRFQDTVRPAAEAITRVDRWKQRLLDLSLRNRLLNFRPTQATLGLPHLDLGRLEDALASEGSLLLQHKPARLPTEPGAGDQVRALVKEHQARGVALTDAPPADHDRRLLELWRQSRAAYEESGAILLYLTLGMLKWTEPAAAGQPRYAPLVLVPVELERGANSWRLKRADDDTRVNITLLKKLERDFGLDVRGLDVLHEDESGLDIARAIHDFRKLVRDRQGWEVVEEAHLGLFSFQKFLMWLDLEAKQEALLQNPVVKHLLQSKGGPFPTTAPLVEEGALDEARAPADVLTVVDADPSQLSAILAADDGTSFVLQGPPGTGKSQTITNLIALLLARGRSVLFVSEKLAALEVVQRRLSAVGLGPFCLELHSHQAGKAAVMAQLKQVFEVTARRDRPSWSEHTKRLGEARTRLNAHAARLAAPSPFGVPAREVLASLFGLEGTPRRSFPEVDPKRLTADTVRSRREAARLLAVAATEVGDIGAHPLRGVGRRDWDPAWARQVTELAGQLAAAARAFDRSAAAARAALSLPPEAGLEALLEAARLLRETPAPPAALVQPGGFQARARRAGELVQRGRTLAERRAALLDRWEDGLLQQDLPGLRARIDRWASSFFLIAFFMLWGVRRSLARLARGALPPNDRLSADLGEAQWVAGEVQGLGAAEGEAQQLLGERWAGLRSDWSQLDASLQWAARFHALLLQVLDRAGSPTSIQRLQLLGTEQAELVGDGTRTGKVLQELLRDAAAYDALRNQAAAALELNATEAFGADPAPDRVAQVADGWARSTVELRAWCGLAEAKVEAEQLGLKPLVEGLWRGELTPARLGDTLERSLREAWWEDLLAREPELRSFRGSSYQTQVQAFRELDSRALQIAREEIVARLAERVPDPHAPGDEMGLLRRQLLLQRRHMPIRQLFAKIPTTLRKLKPCVLMSPLSVAQYLDPSLPGFDVVVFDEASQIPPWDAVGAIARGRQVIVVGDSRQLPPTSFFERASDDEEILPDEEDVQETESILDEMTAARLRELLLRWHYRSKHESLIAFSNRHYYDGRLYTFPSAAGEVPELGVKLVKVQGHYDRGGSRTNRAEAEAVVAELVRLLQLPDDARPSVGVVTFSMVQQRLVEDLLDVKLKEHPELQRFMTDAVPEPVFIKNLENVQGDERDVMLFSICYGQDAAGKVTMNFGPLNRKGGERRLNVAITRARKRLSVYATLDWGMIDEHRTRAVGVSHLKAFLRFAEQGASALLATTTAPDRDRFDSPFEEQVHRVLVEAGWEVHCQVGCSGYRIDLGVVDPERPGTYLLGIECDGAAYHSSRNARERDRLREEVLRSLGWRITRIWSTDWWYDRKGQRERLLAAVQEARKQAGAPPPPPAPSAPPPTATRGPSLEERLAAAPTVSWPKEASAWREPSVLPAGAAKEAFYEATSRARLGAALQQVVDTCGPLHRDVAHRAVAAAWGFTALGKRIQAQLDAALQALPAATRPVLRGDHLWPAALQPATWRGFRFVEGGAGREIDEVAEEEIANVGAWVLERAVTISEAELTREVARVFGIKSVTARVSARVRLGLQRLAAARRVTIDGDRWRWVA